MRLQVDTDQLNELVSTADAILLTKDGEDTILKLLEIQNQVEEAIKQAKANIEKKALEIDPNFMSVQGDRIKVAYRAYGTRYMIDESHLKDLPENLYKKVIKVYPDTKAIDDLANKTGMLPIGIVEPSRPKQIIIGIKKGVK